MASAATCSPQSNNPRSGSNSVSFSAEGSAHPVGPEEPWATMIRAGANAYRRERDLPKLLASYPADTESIVAILQKRYAAQAMLGIRQHWSYDLNKHLALASALKAEKATLAHEANVRELGRIFKVSA